MQGGLRFPERGRFRSIYKVLETGSESELSLSVQGMGLAKLTPQPAWIERTELRLSTPAFDRAAGHIPASILVTVVIRTRPAEVKTSAVEDAARRLVLFRDKNLVMNVSTPQVQSERAVQGVVPIAFTSAAWRLSVQDFLAWTQGAAEATGFGWASIGSVTLSMKSGVRSGVLDFASRLLPELPESAPAPAAPAPSPARLSAPGSAGAPEQGMARAAIDRGLAWLAAHQSEDGGWEAEGFAKWCDGKANTGSKPDGPGKPMYDAGVTGLALLAFLEAGYTTRGEHAYAKVLQRGLAYLVSVQDPEGCLGPRSTQHYIYNHAIAAHALVEAYGISRSVAYHGPAQRGLDFIALARNPSGVWRYGVKPGDNDTSVTGWMLEALLTARRVNEAAAALGQQPPLKLDEAAFPSVLAWLDKMTDRATGRAGYVTRGSGAARPQELIDRFPAEKSESMTAVALLGRLALGESQAAQSTVQRGVALCLACLPRWDTNDGSIDFYYWFVGTRAMRRAGGSIWATWRAALLRTALSAQRTDSTRCDFAGSWDPVDPWGVDGGRVYSTAIVVRSLIACGQ